MSKLKCPFCKQTLQYDDLLCSCINEHCEESFDMVGTELLWQKVIDLKQEIDSTRKALEIATGAIDEILYLDSGKFCKEPAEMWKIAKSAKDKITALEQKDN